MTAGFGFLWIHINFLETEIRILNKDIIQLHDYIMENEDENENENEDEDEDEDINEKRSWGLSYFFPNEKME
jgi:hypothetical protein